MNPASKPEPKIGEGHAAAMLRQGLKELQAAIYPDSNISREPEIGTFGHPTQGEIASERKADMSPSIINAHVQDARASKAARESSRDEREPPALEPERD